MRPQSRRFAALLCATLTLACLSAPFAWSAPAAGGAAPEDLSKLTDGAEIYRQACQACHGEDGKGSPIERVGFDLPLPDFTDCSFASREPSADWVGIAHQGGPVRAFSRMMPAFGEALAPAQLEAAVEHIHAFCTESQWPRAESTLPRPLATGKAYLEDETVQKA